MTIKNHEFILSSYYDIAVPNYNFYIMKFYDNNEKWDSHVTVVW